MKIKGLTRDEMIAEAAHLADRMVEERRKRRFEE